MQNRFCQCKLQNLKWNAQKHFLSRLTYWYLFLEMRSNLKHRGHIGKDVFFRCFEVSTQLCSRAILVQFRENFWKQMPP